MIDWCCQQFHVFHDMGAYLQFSFSGVWDCFFFVGLYLHWFMSLEFVFVSGPCILHAETFLSQLVHSVGCRMENHTQLRLNENYDNMLYEYFGYNFSFNITM